MKVGSGQLALIGRVARAKELRRLNLAFVAFAISEHASWLAVLFYALERGGAEEVGLVAVVQLAPAVLLTPFSSLAGDRFSPRTALAAGYGAQCVAMTATAETALKTEPGGSVICIARENCGRRGSSSRACRSSALPASKSLTSNVGAVAAARIAPVCTSMATMQPPGGR